MPVFVCNAVWSAWRWGENEINQKRERKKNKKKEAIYQKCVSPFSCVGPHTVHLSILLHMPHRNVSICSRFHSTCCCHLYSPFCHKKDINLFLARASFTKYNNNNNIMSRRKKIKYQSGNSSNNNREKVESKEEKNKKNFEFQAHPGSFQTPGIERKRSKENLH